MVVLRDANRIWFRVVLGTLRQLLAKEWAMTATEGMLRTLNDLKTKTPVRLPTPAKLPVMVSKLILDIDVVLDNLRERRREVDALFEQQIDAALAYRRTCEELMVKLRDTLHEKKESNMS